MMVMPVMPTASISDGHIPTRTKQRPMKNPTMAKKMISARSTPRKIVKYAIIRGTSMILNPQKKRPELGRSPKQSAILLNGFHIHLAECSKVSPHTSMYGSKRELDLIVW